MATKKKLKVFGGMIFYGTPRGQYRTLVAAYTKKQAVENLSKFSYIPMSQFNNYFSETGNSVELSIANEVGVWIVKKSFSVDPKDFERIL